MVSNKSGGGIKIANNLLTTEEGYVLDARQGKVLDEKIAETKDNLLKMIQISGVLYGDTDWNIYISAGTYIVNQATMTTQYHAPAGMYRYGTLQVLVPQVIFPKRIAQIYYPHNINHGGNKYVMATRTCEGDTWQPWYAVSGTLLQ